MPARSFFLTFNEALGVIDPTTNLIPDDYAGAYIDENNELKICVTQGQAEKYAKQIDPAVVASTIEKMQGPITYLQKKSIARDILEVVEKTFSYKFLNAIQDALDLKMMEFPISQTNIYQDKNCIEIELTDMSAKDQVTAYLQSTVPDFIVDAISYKQAESLSAKTNYAYAGIKTYHELFAASYGSVGFNASYKDSSGKVHYGVVTNAHVAPLNKSMKLSALKTIGKNYSQ